MKLYMLLTIRKIVWYILINQMFISQQILFYKWKELWIYRNKKSSHRIVFFKTWWVANYIWWSEKYRIVEKILIKTKNRIIYLRKLQRNPFYWYIYKVSVSWHLFRFFNLSFATYNNNERVYFMPLCTYQAINMNPQYTAMIYLLHINDIFLQK